MARNVLAAVALYCQKKVKLVIVKFHHLLAHKFISISWKMLEFLDTVEKLVTTLCPTFL